MFIKVFSNLGNILDNEKKYFLVGVKSVKDSHGNELCDNHWEALEFIRKNYDKCANATQCAENYEVDNNFQKAKFIYQN